MNSPIFSSPRGASFRILNWIARVLGLAFVALLSFAWWEESHARQDPMLSGETRGDWFFQWAIFTHVLPAIFLLAVVLFAWSRPLWGALGFGLYAAAQLFVVGGEWIYLPLVAGPPLIIATVYLVAYLLRRKALPESARA